MKRIAFFAIAAAAAAVLPVTQTFATENEPAAPTQPVPAAAKVDAAELNALLTDSANRIQPHLTSDQRRAVTALKTSLDVR
jgi:hypothetical protein